MRIFLHIYFPNIARLIDWIIRLRPDLELELNERVVLLEKEANMPHITSMEQRGIQIGIEQGIYLGQTNLMMKLLTTRLGELPTQLRERIESLESSQIEALSDELFKISSIRKLNEWLSRC